MDNLQDYFLRTGTLICILAIVALTELTKRVVYAYWPDLRKVRTPQGIQYRTRFSRLWHELWLYVLPVVWGLVLACIRIEFLWDKLGFTSSLLVGLVLGYFSAYLAKLVLGFLPKRYGVEQPTVQVLSQDVDVEDQTQKPPES